jgi:hypothetical protein
MELLDRFMMLEKQRLQDEKKALLQVYPRVFDVNNNE